MLGINPFAKNILIFELELFNEGTEPWEISDHIALRDLDRSFFRHEVLHESIVKSEDGLDREQYEETNGPQLLDDSRGMQKTPNQLYMKNKVEQYKTGHQLSEKQWEDPDLVHDDEIL